MEEGWLCPRCGRVNAPFIAFCNCKKEEFDKNNLKFDKTVPVDTSIINVSRCKNENHDWQLDISSSTDGMHYTCNRCMAKKK